MWPFTFTDAIQPLLGDATLTHADTVRAGAVVLAGGRSRRMGQPKAHLHFGSETMLHRVVRILQQVVAPIVVVSAPGQSLPPLPSGVRQTSDAVPDRGPLEGLAAGLGALQAECDAAYVCSCDAPLLRAAFVQKMVRLLNNHHIAVPRVGGYHHPLAAVYRIEVLPYVEALLATNRLRPAFLFDQTDVRIVESSELIGVDPQLDSLRNCNHPEDYHAALAQAGFDLKTGDL